MKRPRLGRWRLALACVLLLPLVLWAVVVAVLPTDAARRRIAGRLNEASGRHVSIGRLRVGLCGGVSLSDLRIGAPNSGEDPWLRLAEARINISPAQLVFGRIEPTEIRVDGLRLRVLRRKDGTIELGDFLQAPQGAQATAADVHDHGRTGMLLRVRHASVEVRDEPSGTRLEFTDVEGRATCDGRVTRISELWGKLNGGTFAAAFQIDRTGESPAFEGQLKAKGVALTEGMNALAYLVPVIAGSRSTLDGKLSMDLYAGGQVRTRDDLRRTLQGHGKVVLDPVRLDGSPFMNELGHVVDLPPEGRIGAVKADFVIQNGRVGTENLTLDVCRVPLVLEGWTGFDGALAYRLKVDGLTGRLSSRAKAFLSDLSVDLTDLADVRLVGSVDALSVTVDGLSLNPEGKSAGDRQRLRQIGRKIRDRIQR